MSTEREPMVGDGRDGTTDDVLWGYGGREETAGDRSAGPAMPEPPMDSQQEREPLLPSERTAAFRDRWDRIQTGFVDEPRSSVQEADRLVADVIQDLQSSFANERETLEVQWQRGDEVQTEDLRVALQRYRSFFDRLLAA